ncbi:glycoside hydrolase family 10 protein [Egbenema bharatensis]|uniref:glycoside hydrolase family 10 protein n=1 Tax=Egbenema bharatensis TaxID=3463334 RepID=UPI003A8B9E77
MTANPDWASYDHRGSLNLPGHEEPFLDPANPAVRRYLLQLYEEIVTRYDVDGLQLDYIRYPFQNPYAGRTHGYGTAARQQFQQLTGVDPITLTSRSGPLWQQWTEFRVEQITSFVAETSEMLDRVRPEVVLSTAVFAMPTQERIQKLQQNWEVWAQNGYVDMVVLMAYAADTNRLQQLTQPWLTGERENLGSAIILPGIRILNLPDAVVFDQIQALRDLPSGGYALFAAAHLHENLQGILNRTQGLNQSDPIPFREPFAAATQRFTALRREWNLMLSQDQLWIREAEREAWQAQVEALNQALVDLAENPSRRRLSETQAQLQDFQTQFDDWMYLQSLTQSYRVRTWNNRLTVISNLLEYGERGL